MIGSNPSTWYCESQPVNPIIKRLLPKLCPGALYTEVLKCASRSASKCEADSTCTWNIYSRNFIGESVYQANMNASFGYLNKQVHAIHASVRPGGPGLEHVGLLLSACWIARPSIAIYLSDNEERCSQLPVPPSSRYNLCVTARANNTSLEAYQKWYSVVMNEASTYGNCTLGKTYLARNAYVSGCQTGYAGQGQKGLTIGGRQLISLGCMAQLKISMQISTSILIQLLKCVYLCLQS